MSNAYRITITSTKQEGDAYLKQITRQRVTVHPKDMPCAEKNVHVHTVATPAEGERGPATGTDGERGPAAVREELKRPRDDVSEPATAATSAGAQTPRRTRSGRSVKKPTRYEPVERCTDDFGSDEYDSDDSIMFADI